MSKLRTVLVAGLFCFVLAGIVFGANEVPKKCLVLFKKDLNFAETRGHASVVRALQQQLDRNLNSIKKSFNFKILAKLWIANGIVANLTPSEVKKLSTFKNVSEIRPVIRKRWIDKDIDKKPVSRSDTSAVQWSIAKVNAPQVWNELKID